MSQVKKPREIKISQRTFTITITGNYSSSSYGYVKVGSATYSSNQTLTFTVPPNTYPTIEVMCSTASSTESVQNSCKIYLDGVLVQDGKGSYTFTAYRSYNITLTRTGSTTSTRYWTADIVSA